MDWATDTFFFTNLGRDKNLSLLWNIQQRSGAHSAPYSVGKLAVFPWG